jgi:hypothetical protein
LFRSGLIAAGFVVRDKLSRLFHPISAGIEGKQQNVTFSETSRPQAGNEVRSFAKEDGSKQAPLENEHAARAEER